MNDKLPFLLNKKEISRWAYHYCKDIKNDIETKEYITHSEWAYWYCKKINNDPIVRKKYNKISVGSLFLQNYS